MANMAYCRFQNTITDFRDCINSIYDVDPRNHAEVQARRRLIEQAAFLLAEIGISDPGDRHAVSDAIAELESVEPEEDEY